MTMSAWTWPELKHESEPAFLVWTLFPQYSSNELFRVSGSTVHINQLGDPFLIEHSAELSIRDNCCDNLTLFCGQTVVALWG